jgi:hypothetical protein
MMKQLTLALVLIVSQQALHAQDTLPKFSVRNIGANRIVVSWVNPLNNVTQISVQRSFDSGKYFKTILSVADPKALNNGFADTKAPHDSMYYRLFYAVEGGAFFFSESKRPFKDTVTVVTNPKQPAIVPPPVVDSVTKKKIETFVPSFYVYTQKDGYVFINLPDADKEKYHIKFFEDDGSFIFEIKGIRETALTLDKANFYHSGWFRFELYKDDKLVEKHKFYLPKDF